MSDNCNDTLLDSRYPVVGYKYQHYKGKQVTVLVVGVMEDSKEAAVIYAHSDGTGPVWVRLLSDWMRPVGGENRSRFFRDGPQ